MDEASLGMSSPPFGPGDRASGILLHVTSLPSPYGIGDLGPSAFAWVDRLARSGQSWWQALPLGPTGYGDSPYQPLSSFAGNILLISPDGLIADGLLRPGELEVPAFPTGEVDYPAVTRFKHRLLERAWSNFRAGAAEGLRPAFERFCLDQAHWLDDYALFRALKIRHGGAHYLDWPEPLVRRDPAALDAARRELADLIDLARFGQFLVVHQGDRLRDYARTRGVQFIGDLPFFVSPDSADVWANPQFFQLDARRRPRLVAGVPPDYFSPEGQLWGNPVYDWEALRRAGYRWWIDRLRALLAHVDLVRLDHFRGFAAAWHVPAGAPRPARASGSPGPARISSGPPGTSWAACRSSPRTWASSRPTSAAPRATCTSPGCGCCNSRSAGTRTTRTSPTTSARTPSSTRAPTTTTRRGAGTRPCRRRNGGPSGATSADPPGRRRRSPGSCSASPGRPPPRWPWPRSRTC